MKAIHRILVASLFLAFFSACDNPQSGPDKTLGAAVLGAGWGAGAGAVVGHQVGYTGEGAGVGAGFGAVGGALVGMGYDLNESAILDQEEALASLKLQNSANAQELAGIQARLDNTLGKNLPGGVQHVFFDVDATSLKAGSIATLEVLADQFHGNSSAITINVVGHSDDTGDQAYNVRLAEARARAVSAYLAQRGISLSQIKVASHGSERPLASNSTPTGRQLNRRVDVFVSK